MYSYKEYNDVQLRSYKKTNIQSGQIFDPTLTLFTCITRPFHLHKHKKMIDKVIFSHFCVFTIACINKKIGIKRNTQFYTAQNIRCGDQVLLHDMNTGCGMQSVQVIHFPY